MNEGREGLRSLDRKEYERLAIGGLMQGEGYIARVRYAFERFCVRPCNFKFEAVTRRDAHSDGR